MQRRNDAFVAHDKDGRTRTVHIVRTSINARTHDDPDAVVEGLARLETSDGLSVNCLGKGRYQIVQTGVLLHSDAPNAP